MPLPQENKCCVMCRESLADNYCNLPECKCHQLKSPQKEPLDRNMNQILDNQFSQSPKMVAPQDIGKVEDWEKEWKTARIRHFSQNTGEFPEIDGVLWVASDDVKSFIKSLLSSHTEKLRKEIEGMNSYYGNPKGKEMVYKKDIFALLNNEEVK